jgi:hypothetical protein
MYRKPTQTDTIIPNDSCHPHEYKTSSINYLVNILKTYPVSKETKVKELNILKITLHNNNYKQDKNIHPHEKRIQKLNHNTQKETGPL